MIQDSCPPITGMDGVGLPFLPFGDRTNKQEGKSAQIPSRIFL